MLKAQKQLRRKDSRTEVGILQGRATICFFWPPQRWVRTLTKTPTDKQNGVRTGHRLTRPHKDSSKITPSTPFLHSINRNRRRETQTFSPSRWSKMAYRQIATSMVRKMSSAWHNECLLWRPSSSGIYPLLFCLKVLRFASIFTSYRRSNIWVHTLSQEFIKKFPGEDHFYFFVVCWVCWALFLRPRRTLFSTLCLRNSHGCIFFPCRWD